MAELKECKYCGIKPTILYSADAYFKENVIGHKVFCPKCGMHTFYYKSEEQAIRAWNKRGVE